MTSFETELHQYSEEFLRSFAAYYQERVKRGLVWEQVGPDKWILVPITDEWREEFLSRFSEEDRKKHFTVHAQQDKKNKVRELYLAIAKDLSREARIELIREIRGVEGK